MFRVCEANLKTIEFVWAETKTNPRIQSRTEVLQRTKLPEFVECLYVADEKEKADEDNSKICRCNQAIIVLLTKPEKLSRGTGYRKGMMKSSGLLKQSFRNV